MQNLEATIRYEAESDKNFAGEISALPGCESLRDCIQCGTCSGTCPFSIYMDYTPRRIIHLTRSGFKKDVLTSKTIWLCASCYSCAVECPKKIKITDIMYVLKQKAIKGRVQSRKIPVAVLAGEFYGMVKRYGRVTESILVMFFYLRTNVIDLLRMWNLGLKLILKGRFSFSLDKVKNRKEIAKLLETDLE